MSKKVDKQKDSFDNIGRSVLEMMAVLAIMGVLTVGGMIGYSKAMPRFKMSKLAEQISLMITNIRAAYSIKDNYEGLNTIAAIHMGAIPKEMVKGNPQNAYNSFGGQVFVTPAEDNKSVFITITGLPANACVYIGSADWGGQMGSGLVSVATLSQTTQAAVSEQQTEHIATAEDKTLPLSIVEASAGCNGVGQTNAVVIQYH